MQWFKYVVNPERAKNILPSLDFDMEKLFFLSFKISAGSMAEVTLFHEGLPVGSPLKWRQRNHIGLNMAFNFSCDDLRVLMPGGLFGQTKVQLSIDEKSFKVKSRDDAKKFNIEAAYSFLALDIKPNEPL
jgi:hypothetical protein